MSYCNGRTIHDADSHVMETRDWLVPFVDAAYADKLPALFDAKLAYVDDVVSAARKRKVDAAADVVAAKDPIGGPKGWAAYGAFDPEERKRVLDTLGFASQLVFPTVGIVAMRIANEIQIKYAACRAYNRAIAAFCRADPRLIAAAYIQHDDAALALSCTREALDVGCRAVMLPSTAPGQRSPGHPVYDPFWALLCELDVPFLLHIGPGTLQQPQPFRDNGRARAPGLGEGAENLRFCDYPMLCVAPQIFLTAMIYDGVFMRFPTLRGGVIESGAGWVPEFLRTLDFSYRVFGKSDPYLQVLDLLPSEYLRRAIKFTPSPGEDVNRLIRETGSELYMFSSDYPHPEGTNDPLRRFDDNLRDSGPLAQERFFRRNFEEMMGARVFMG